VENDYFLYAENCERFDMAYGCTKCKPDHYLIRVENLDILLIDTIGKCT